LFACCRHLFSPDFLVLAEFLRERGISLITIVDATVKFNLWKRATFRRLITALMFGAAAKVTVRQ
jgi:hypothetical protein